MFRPSEENEELVGPKVPYLRAIGVFIYFVNATRPDITICINLLERYNSSPPKRHLNRIKHILQYLKKTIDMSLSYANKDNAYLVGHRCRLFI